MAYERLRFDRTETHPIKDDRELLVIRMKDHQGTEYSWAPKWDDLREAFRQAYFVETRNARREPEKFEVLLRSLLSTQRIQHADLVTGRLARLRDGYVELVTEEAYTLDDEFRDEIIEMPEQIERYPVAFEFDEDWLLRHLQQQVRCLVIGGAVCGVEPIPDAGGK